MLKTIELLLFVCLIPFAVYAFDVQLTVDRYAVTKNNSDVVFNCTIGATDANTNLVMKVTFHENDVVFYEATYNGE